MGYKRGGTVDERFDRRVAVADGDCWEWRGHVNNQGYGIFFFDSERVMAHRHAYMRANGGIPDGFVIDHLCRNRSCVNPEHLEAVTNRENILRGVGQTAREIAKTHCPRGHLYDEGNTYRPKWRNVRICLTCKREYDRKRWANRYPEDDQ